MIKITNGLHHRYHHIMQISSIGFIAHNSLANFDSVSLGHLHTLAIINYASSNRISNSSFLNI